MTAQSLILYQIRTAGRWNNFDGPRIATDLEENSTLWSAAYLTIAPNKLFPELREYSLDHRYNLQALRDLSEEGYVYNDILFVLPKANAHNPHSHLFPDEARALLHLWWD